MSKAGINVDDPRWLREVLIKDESGSYIHQRKLTDPWQQWARGLDHTPTAREIIDFAQMLESQYILEGYGYREGSTIDWKALYMLLEQAQQAQQGGQ